MGFRFQQFSVTEHFQNMEAGHMQSPPGVFFYYDLSPIKVCLFFFFRSCVNNNNGDYVSENILIFWLLVRWYLRSNMWSSCTS